MDSSTTWPWDATCDYTGNVYVADWGYDCIQVFTVEGKFSGKKGHGDGELNSTHVNNHRVSVLTSEGQFLRSFGTKGAGPGQFNDPRGIAMDKDGLVYVSESA